MFVKLSKDSVSSLLRQFGKDATLPIICQELTKFIVRTSFKKIIKTRHEKL